MGSANPGISYVNDVKSLRDQTTLVPGAVQVDDTHRAIIRLVKRLGDADDKEFEQLFMELVVQMEMQIGKQNYLMKRSRYPGRITHQAEYMRILGKLAQMRRQVLNGNLSAARVFIRNKLGDWLNSYGAAMDAALVAHLKVRTVAQALWPGI